MTTCPNDTLLTRAGHSRKRVQTPAVRMLAALTPGLE